ncbi:hypothetical protein BGX28_006356, partial [Mortierella sp. GBA30]
MKLLSARAVVLAAAAIVASLVASPAIHGHSVSDVATSTTRGADPAYSTATPYLNSSAIWQEEGVVAENGGNKKHHPNPKHHRPPAIPHPQQKYHRNRGAHRPHGKYVRHRHHKPRRPHRRHPFPQYRHRRLYVRQNLVCNGIVIDKLFCKYRVRIANPIMTPSLGTGPSLGTLNNGGRIRVKHVNIIMGEPCSKVPPPRTAAAQEAFEAAMAEGLLAAEVVDDFRTSNGRKLKAVKHHHLLHRPNRYLHKHRNQYLKHKIHHPKRHGLRHGIKNGRKHGVRHGIIPGRKHGLRHGAIGHRHKPGITHGIEHGPKHDIQHGHKHDIQHGHKHEHMPGANHGIRHGGHHRHRRHHRKGRMHPYKDYCVATGPICGANLFGCHFDPKTLYSCKAIGEKPVVVMPDSKLCGGRNGGSTTPPTHRPCSCTVLGKHSICGSDLPVACAAKANAIYVCPSADDVAPDLLNTCSPDTQCRSRPGKDPICYGSTVPPNHLVCSCKDIGKNPVCGSDLPKACTAKANSIYFCPSADDVAPELLSVCNPGTQCRPRPGKDPICGFTSCDCKGEVQVCSEQFPDKCLLQDNTVYKCGANNKPEVVKKCAGDHACVAVSDGALCRSKDCKCSEDGDFCGEMFPLSCRIQSTSLYTCKKGESPVSLKSCLPGRCTASTASIAAYTIFASEAADQCIDSCSCTGKNTVCGSTFPPECNLEAARLYTCTGSGSTPAQDKTCNSGNCIVNAGDNTCGDKVECTCPGDGTKAVCGSQLPQACNADPAAVYHCADGAGSAPTILKYCQPGTKCLARPDEDAVCGYINCVCSGSNEVCSQQFPDGCGLIPNSVYMCTTAGAPELVETCQDTEGCITAADGSVCANRDCTCPDSGVACAELFPVSCGLASSNIYTCKKGEKPTVLKSCSPGACTASVANMQATAIFDAMALDDKCLDSCLCDRKGVFCGSTFPPSCKLEPNTLYDCSGSGQTPQKGEVCKYECSVQAGDNVCPNNDCTCPGPGEGPVCGYELPEACNALPNNIYICRKGKGSIAEVLSVCRPATQCQKRSLPLGAICGTATCSCSGDYEVCSDSFPDSCELEKNTVYMCTADGTPQKSKNCQNGTVCNTVLDGSYCGSAECVCQRNGTFSGGVFPHLCKIKATAIYECKIGSPPVMLADCYPSRCSSPKSAIAAAAVFDEFKKDPCTCTDKRRACGSTFPPSCKYHASTLFTCTGNGAKPVFKEDCRIGGCTVAGGDNYCNPDPCTCPGLGMAPICGYELPKECNADSNAIYQCPGGSGTRPDVLAICKPGKLCQKKPLPQGAVCGSSTCDCTGDEEICSDTFPEECGLEKNAVYKCASSGKPVLLQKCDYSQSCVSVTDGSVCANADCECHNNGTVCGEIFPLACRLHTTALYTCGQDGYPKFLSNCYPDRCATTKSAIAGAAVFAKSADQCVDTCTCAGSSKVCGSTFPPSCGFDNMTLYSCDGNGSPPSAAVKCTLGGCTVNGGEDACSTDPCTCPGDGLTPVPGSSLPEACGVDPNTVYYCPGGAGTKPKILAIGHPGTLCQSKPAPVGAICGSTTCDCKGNFEVCSDSFPENCTLETNSIYKCTENGTPELVSRCDVTETCVTVSDGSVCTIPDCKCPTDGVVCGEVFPISCRIKKLALYACSVGGEPVLQKDCDPMGCSAFKNSFAAAASVFAALSVTDQCTDFCTCQATDMVCGSTFPPKCNFDSSSLYRCGGKGAQPSVAKQCVTGTCAINAGTDDCVEITGNCTCPNNIPVCGSDLVDKCAGRVDINPNAVYRCPGGNGTLPEIQDLCKPGTTCQAKPAPIGGACGGNTCNCTGVKELCSDNFSNDCGLLQRSVYKCTQNGTPELVKTCDAGTECITLADGSVCMPMDCLCPKDGDACGELFPASCNMVSTALYTCSKGGKPVFKSDCAPERCSTSKPVVAADVMKAM